MTVTPAQAFILGMAVGIVLALAIEKAKVRRGCAECEEETP